MKFSPIVIVLLLLILGIFIMKKSSVQNQGGEHQDHVVPRYHPVYLDAQTPYLNEQIMYGEWDQEISSSL